jgi:hypothetical protein
VHGHISMTNSYDTHSEHELERIGRIRSLKSLEKGDQVTIYYNCTISKVEIHIEKFDSPMTEKAKLLLSMEEAKQLIKLLEDSTVCDGSSSFGI